MMLTDTGADMRGDVKILAGLLAAGWIGLSSTVVSAGEWKYGEDFRGNSELQYLEGGKTTFYIGCGRAFGLHVHYPRNARKSGPATITISAGKASMAFKGEFQEADKEMATEFLQWDLGFRRQDPELYGKRWKAMLSRLLDLLGSGKPLVISAGKDSYQLPPNDAKNWREPFDGCG
jgi:hypothetical protein